MIILRYKKVNCSNGENEVCNYKDVDRYTRSYIINRRVVYLNMLELYLPYC